ncbi:MAG TPA: hypothetical protein VEO95_02885 [Chthoniobacteraceae bacterium]|nr:hypothetical protein [Chthoniobacteraceae bacterium]
MNATTEALIGLGILSLLVMAFFAVFRGKGKFQLDTKFGKLKAEGENPPPPGAVAAGVKIKDAGAGKDVRAHSTSSGGVDFEKVKAKGGIEATHMPGESPPKP